MNNKLQSEVYIGPNRLLSEFTGWVIAMAIN